MTDSKDKKTTAGKAKTASGSKAKATATEATQSVAKSTLTTSTLPTAADLKDRFKAGSIPLQTDFADLIDMANTGATALGLASGQTSAGDGLKIDDNGLLQLKLDAAIKSKDYAPLIYHSGILSTNLGSGLQYKTNGICVGEGKGITVATDDISVKAGKGITVNESGVGVDMAVVIPKGIITMFSGSKVPDGWLFCDGTNGTPNLIDRFILGGYVEDNGKKNNITLSGDKTSKTFSAQTNTVTPSINVTVAGHALTVNEMPSHNHSLSGTSHTGGTHLAFDCHVDGGYAGSATTSSAGGGAAHNHSASAKQDAHGHSIDIAVPYYILAFIMKS